MYPVEIKLDGHRARSKLPGRLYMKASLFGLSVAVFVGCAGPKDSSPKFAQAGPAMGQTSQVGISADDVRSLLESEVGRLVSLRSSSFDDQTSIPLQIDGAIDGAPSTVFGKPVVLTQNYIQASIDSWPSSSVYLSVGDPVKASLRIKIRRCWGTGSENAEAWVTRESDTWKVVEVVSQMTML